MGGDETIGVFEINMFGHFNVDSQKDIQVENINGTKL